MAIFDPSINPRVFHDWRHFLAFGMGSGLARKAPGTWGTLASVPFCVLLWWMLPVVEWFIVLLVFTGIGVVLCDEVSRDLGTHDHGGIVWDEWVGYGFSLIALPQAWFSPVLAFVLFRLLDIWKPWPISWCDEHVHGGVGIMLDDVLAGLFTCITLNVLWRSEWTQKIFFSGIHLIQSWWKVLLA